MASPRTKMMAVDRRAAATQLNGQLSPSKVQRPADVARESQTFLKDAQQDLRTINNTIGVCEDALQKLEAAPYNTATHPRICKVRTALERARSQRADLVQRIELLSQFSDELVPELVGVDSGSADSKGLGGPRDRTHHGDHGPPSSAALVQSSRSFPHVLVEVDDGHFQSLVLTPFVATAQDLRDNNCPELQRQVGVFCDTYAQGVGNHGKSKWNLFVVVCTILGPPSSSDRLPVANASLLCIPKRAYVHEKPMSIDRAKAALDALAAESHEAAMTARLEELRRKALMEKLAAPAHEHSIPGNMTPRSRQAWIQEEEKRKKKEKKKKKKKKQKVSKLAVVEALKQKHKQEQDIGRAIKPKYQKLESKADVSKFGKIWMRRKKKEISRNDKDYDLTIAMMLGIHTVTKAHASGEAMSADKVLRVAPKKSEFTASLKLVFPPEGGTATVLTGTGVMEDQVEKPIELGSHLLKTFEFKDYASTIFARLRACRGIKDRDYLASLAGEMPYITFISNSKSGMFFFYTYNRRFMIKSMPEDECKFFRSILENYYEYMIHHPDSLICQVLGLHRVTLKGRAIHFIVMTNVFYTDKHISRRFDLKGSTIGRSATEREKKQLTAVLKDLDFTDTVLHMGNARDDFLLQLQTDANFLAGLKIMDYSLLVGIHNHETDQLKPVQRVFGLSDAQSPAVTTRQGKAEVTAWLHENLDTDPMSPQALDEKDEQPLEQLDEQELEDEEDELKGAGGGDATRASGGSAGVFTFDSADVKRSRTDPDVDALVHKEAGPRTPRDSIAGPVFSQDEKRPVMLRRSRSGRNTNHSVPQVTAFQTDSGGFRARNPDGTERGEVYFMGIIDILQLYTAGKKVEHALKSIYQSSTQISAVEPDFYAKRFVDFIKSHCAPLPESAGAAAAAAAAAAAPVDDK